jgi:2-phosphoglycerate kinase
MTDSRERLDHVLWIGGSPCSGKTSIAELLAEQHGLPLYHVDEMFERHRQRVSLAVHPNLYKWTHTGWNSLWMQSGEVLLAEAIGCYREQFEMVVEDLAERGSEELVLAEGSSLLPGSVAKVMVGREQGIWIVPTEEFQRARYRERGSWVEGILAECDDPETAYRNWMDRDVAFGQWVRGQAEKLDLEVLEVSGRRSIASNAEIVAAHSGLI